MRKSARSRDSAALSPEVAACACVTSASGDARRMRSNDPEEGVGARRRREGGQSPVRRTSGTHPSLRSVTPAPEPATLCKASYLARGTCVARLPSRRPSPTCAMRVREGRLTRRSVMAADRKKGSAGGGSSRSSGRGGKGRSSSGRSGGSRSQGGQSRSASGRSGGAGGGRSASGKGGSPEGGSSRGSSSTRGGAARRGFGDDQGTRVGSPDSAQRKGAGSRGGYGGP